MYNPKQLSNIYDRQIRLKCDDLRDKYLKCLEENFNDEFICEPYHNEFLKCVSIFDEEFRAKYNLKPKKL
jgi:hypothetical protein